MSKSISKTSNALNDWGDLRPRLILEGILVGVLSGLIVVAYRVILDYAEEIRLLIYSFINSKPTSIFLWFLALAIIAYILGLIVKAEPLVGGSGIPQVKGQLMGKIYIRWPKVILWKFIGGVLAIGVGLSLGREGPSVQLGGAIGHGTGRLLGRSRMENKYLITCGASAGLAAAFNAPLAGVIFVLEELHKNFSPVVLSSAMVASLAADFISQYFFGQRPVFSFPNISPLPLKYYGFLIVLGLLLGVGGVFFNYILLKTQELYKQLSIPLHFRPMIPVLIAGVLGIFLPDVLGGGQKLVIKLGNTDMLFVTLIILVVVKFAFTMLSYGSGVPGGIFLPLLVIGALIGNITGVVFSSFAHLPKEFVDNIIVFAMAGYFTAIVKAPITGMVLITEMTGSFSNLLPVAVVSLSAYLMTDVFRSRPIYEALLEKLLVKSQAPLNLDKKGKKIVLEISIALGSFLDRKYIKDVKWPQECLLVGVIRGEKEIIPKGDTKLQFGDYLVVLTNEKDEAKLREHLQRLSYVQTE